MIFLSGANLPCFYRIPFWNYPCCNNRVVSALPILKKTPCRKNSAKLCEKPQFFGNDRVKTSLTSWIQVRYSNRKCPELHGDVEFPNFDAYRKEEYKSVRKTEWGAGDGKPGFTYVVGFFGLLGAAYGCKSELTRFALYMDAAADILAMSTIEVDIGKVAPGVCLSLKWRGKPLFIKHRTPSEIELEAKTPLSSLRDPQTPEQRMTNTDWLIVIGICTHLGCVPIPNSGDYPGGYYCPCHGSHYDSVGRARKGPAPANLEVPPYKFLSDTLVLVG